MNNAGNTGVYLNRVVTTLFGLARGRHERRAWKNRRVLGQRGRAAASSHFTPNMG